MSWTTSTADLRRLLSDGPTDRYRFRKRVFGELNGTNKTFKTLEFRRVTDFTTAIAPLGVWKNGTLQAGAAISADFPDTGEFNLVTAPADGDLLEASYYINWFLDEEIDDFVLKAVNWLGFGSGVTNLDPGLVPAALNYAASEAYMKMAIRWRDPLSEGFRVEDAPSKEVNGQTQAFIELAKEFQEKARKLRDDFYTRQGQSLSPLYGQVLGNVKDITPRT